MSTETSADGDPETVIVGRGIHSKTAHRPDESDPTRPTCWAVRKTDSGWRRVAWATVAPTHRRCANCFPEP